MICGWIFIPGLKTTAKKYVHNSALELLNRDNPLAMDLKQFLRKSKFFKNFLHNKKCSWYRQALSFYHIQNTTTFIIYYITFCPWSSILRCQAQWDWENLLMNFLNFSIFFYTMKNAHNTIKILDLRRDNFWSEGIEWFSITYL